jgi:hypothetical protein
VRGPTKRICLALGVRPPRLQRRVVVGDQAVGDRAPVNHSIGLGQVVIDWSAQSPTAPISSSR